MQLYQNVPIHRLTSSPPRPYLKRKESLSPSAWSKTNPKRLKISHGSLSPNNSMGENKTPGLHPEPFKVIDLERPVSIQPAGGARRLQIRNLRTSSRKNVDEYYLQLREEIDAALSSVFAQEEIKSPLEVICRGVELLCRRGQTDELYTYYRDRSLSYLENVLLPQIEREITSTGVEALRTVYNFWTTWDKQSTLLRSIFSYLDRSFLLYENDLPRLEELNIQQFRYVVFTKGKGVNDQGLGKIVISNICDLVDYMRTKQSDLFDPALLRQSIQMLHIFGIYSKIFEPQFLERSREFFLKFTLAHNNSGMKEYIHACDSLLGQEILCCETYNFDSNTKKCLLNSAHGYLIEGCSRTLLDPTGLAKLIEENEIPSLKILYKLLSLSGIQAKLRTPFQQHIKISGSLIVGNVELVNEIMIRLLKLKGQLDYIIKHAFNNDDSFSYSLRESFSSFMNDNKILSVWTTKSSKIGELIAKYMDMLLRGGLKAIPVNFISDAQNHANSDNLGVSTSQDQDAELDRQLDQALELFRFIEGKDLFEAFYKKDLARRLLMARSASQDAERSMLSKLRGECGSTFTHNLEQMFKDQEVSRDEMIAYRQSLNNSSRPLLDLQVNILSAAAWPSYPDIRVNIPPEVAKNIESFDRFYVNKHTGRRLTWKHALSHCVIKAKFDKGYKELLVSAFQAVVLVLFNDIDSSDCLSYTTIQISTGLVDVELQRTLQSLACAKFRVLTKHPKGREVNRSDTFTVNLNFTDPKYKIKINQIQLKETKEENKETHEKLLEDRQYETQAAIVRIMKSRKTMTHANLISEVIGQTKKRGTVELSQIKSNIDSMHPFVSIFGILMLTELIDKEYLERVNGGSYVYCA